MISVSIKLKENINESALKKIEQIVSDFCLINNIKKKSSLEFYKETDDICIFTKFIYDFAHKQKELFNCINELILDDNGEIEECVETVKKWEKLGL